MVEPHNPYLPVEEVSAPSHPISKMAVVSLGISLLPGLLMLMVALASVVFWVPPLGLIIAIVALAPLSFITICVQSVAWGLASAASQRIKNHGPMRGLSLCLAARGVALFQGVFALLLVAVVVAMPTLCVLMEIIAWRHVANRGVKSVENTVVEIRELRVGVQTELTRVSESIATLSQSGQSLADELKNMNNSTESMSNSLERLAKESEAWRGEVAAIRQMDLWVWSKETLTRTFGSMSQDAQKYGQGRDVESVTREAFQPSK